MKQRTLIACLLLLTASMAWAADLPPGKWWRRPDVIRQLAITDEQQSRLDGIFRTSADELIDLKAEVEKRSIALRGELDQPQLSRESIRSKAARLNEARNRLFERELMMLVDMRAVLTVSQWAAMRSKLDNMGTKGAGKRGGLR